MSTKIEWCHIPGTQPKVWNLVTGCNKVSQGCKNCYAEVMHKRLTGMGQTKYQQPFLNGAVMHQDILNLPLTYKKPCTIFVNSMSDLFHEDVTFHFLWDVWEIMSATPHHTFIILTKRPSRLFNFFQWAKNLKSFTAALPNVWLGVSCENQETANERIPLLLQIPAAVRFLSCEPLLGAIDLTEITENNNTSYDVLIGKIYHYGDDEEFEKIDWVIAGGESGHNARPMHPNWALKLRDDCKYANVPFFFKQWGEYIKAAPGQIGNPNKNKNFISVNDGNGNWCDMVKVGKKKAGRKINEIEYNEFPNTKF